jgi:4-methyl-5(b-hydroxyethyl)-thiazole monophosphate biosynthesis
MASVLVLLAQGCEELEAVTVIDLLRRAGNLEVVSAGLDDAPVTASRGTRLLADTTIDRVLDRRFDMVVLPGGLPGADHLDRDPRVRELLTGTAGRGGFVAAICAAPKALVNAGLLRGRRATSFPGSLEGLALDGIDLREDDVVVDGRVITSRGPGTAMDFALVLIEELAGAEARQQVEAGLQRPAGQRSAQVSRA